MAINTSIITINASPQKVFEVLTKPELIKLWQFGKEVITNWETGNEIRFRAEWEGKILEQWGTILEMRTNELIKYNLFTPKPELEDRIENYCVTSYVLTNQNEQTQLEIIQEDYRLNVFAPETLKPILALVKNIAESN